MVRVIRARLIRVRVSIGIKGILTPSCAPSDCTHDALGFHNSLLDLDLADDNFSPSLPSCSLKYSSSLWCSGLSRY